MKTEYREIRMNIRNLERLKLVNSIIEEYQSQGLVMTLRQLYYQLVSRDVIPNEQKEYTKLSKLLKEGRMAGVVDWSAIEDRLRQVSVPPSFESPEEILKIAIDQFELPRQTGQEDYHEIWIEKDALSGVLSGLSRKYHIPIMVNRGYSSVTAIHHAYKRIKSQVIKNHRKTIILYLGDFDPSGLDMIRDIGFRIGEFDEDLIKYFDVKHIALTMEQIQKFNPPPNPAKLSDTRAKGFIEKYGNKSWEVDALPPDVMVQIVEDEILENYDMDVYTAILEREKLEKSRLCELAEKL